MTLDTKTLGIRVVQYERKIYMFIQHVCMYIYVYKIKQDSYHQQQHSELLAIEVSSYSRAFEASCGMLLPASDVVAEVLLSARLWRRTQLSLGSIL